MKLNNPVVLNAMVGMLLLLTTGSHAGILTANNLDWLTLDQTSGQTYQQALDANLGYRLATKTEFQNMFLGHYETVGDDLFIDQATTNKTRVGTQYTQYDTDSNDVGVLLTNKFTADFGITLDFAGPGYRQIYSTGFYQTDTGRLRIGGIQFTDFVSITGFNATAWDNDDTNTYGAAESVNTHSAEHVGWFLVTESTSGSVPTPSVLVLLLAGLVGIGRKRIRVNR